MNKSLAKISDSIILFAFALYYAMYTRATMINVAWLTWIGQLRIAERYFAHTLDLKFLLEIRSGENGLFGYNAISLVNLLIFKLNTLFDAYLNVGIVLACGGMLYLDYKDSLDGETGAFLRVPLLLICLIMFSTMQQSSGAMETQVRLGVLFFILASFALSRYMLDRSGKKSVAPILVLLFLSINIFGTCYSIAGFLGLMIAMAIDCVSKKSIVKNYILIISSCVIFWGLYFLMYGFNPFVKVPDVAAVMGSQSVMSDALAVIAHPIISMKAVLAYLGSGTLGRTLLEDGIISNPKIFFVNGLFILTLYLYSMVRFLTSRMYQKTYLPIMMLSYTSFVIILVMIGRSSGWDWGTNYWYAVHTKFGTVACVWILTFDLWERRKVAIADQNASDSKIHYITFLYTGIAGVMLASQIVSNYYDWRRAPYVRQWYEAIAAYAINPDDAQIDSKGNTPLRLSIADSREAIQIMRAHRLSVYSSITGHDLRSAKLISGWYQWEGNDIWMGKESKTYFLTGPRGKFALSGYLPRNYSPNNVTIFMNDKLVASRPITEGSFNIGVDGLPAETIVKLKIVAGQAFVPKKMGWGPDGRELGLLISNITFL